MKRKPGKLIVILMLIAALSPINLPTVKGDSHVVVNELYTSPGPDETEWIELYNPGIAKTLINYRLSDQSGQSDLQLDDYKIESEGFLLLQKGKDFAFSLNNDTDVVTLSQGDQIIDRVAYGAQKTEPTNASAPMRGRSITRVPDGFDSDNSSVDFKDVLPSPGTNYHKQQYSQNLRINELFPSPEGGTTEEFIEILNTGSEKVSLKNWLLDDRIDGGSPPFPLDEFEIIPGQLLVMKNSITGLSLNDDGDSVNLIDPNREISDSVTYGISKHNLSYSMLNGSWEWSTPSPGEPNRKAENSQEIITILEAKQLTDDSKVTTTGIVTVLPNTLSAQYFYIQDATSGLQVYSYYHQFPELALGDEITVSGQLSTSSTERRLKISESGQITRLRGGSSPIAKRVSIDLIDESMIGLYLQVEGEIIEKRSTGFMLGQNSKPLQILIREGTGLKNSDYHRGDKIILAGILSRFNNVFRLLPTGGNDVKILNSGALPLTGGGTTGLIDSCLMLYLVFILWNIHRKAKRIHIISQQNWLGQFKWELFLLYPEIWAAAKPPLLKALPKP